MAIAKDPLVAVESSEEKRLCLLYHHFFNCVALCHVSREKLYNAECAHSTQVLTVHNPLPTETRSLNLSSIQSAFLVWILLPFPSGSQSCSRDGALSYQKHDWEEHPSLAQAVQHICSRRVWARCAALSETDFTAVYILSPALICSFLACPWYGSEGVLLRC